MSRMRIAHFENSAQAEPVRQCLIMQGIKAEVHNELGLAKLWFVSRWQTGARLEVPASDVQGSTQLLHQWDEETGLLHGATRCPGCRSLRVDFPQFTRKSMFTNVVMGFLAEIHVLEREYYCEDCHFMWAKPRANYRRARRHLAPDFFLEGLPPIDPGAEPKAREARAKIAWRMPGAAEEKRCPAFRKRVQAYLHSPWRKTLGLLLIVQVALGPSLLRGADVGQIFATAAPPLAPAKASAHSESPTYLRDVLPILMGKCARCHNEQTSFLQNWLDYPIASQKRWEIKRRVWDSYHGAYFKQPMPTGNSPESQAITEEERTIIRDWVESGAGYGVAPILGSTQSKQEKIEAGKRLFSTICAACHQPSGQGLPGRFPPLAGSDFLNSDKHRAIKIVVNGLQGEVVVNGQAFNNSMPKFPLSDQDIACALTYVYNSFGNSGKEVTPEEVNRVRGERNDLMPMAQGRAASRPEEKSPFE